DRTGAIDCITEIDRLLIAEIHSGGEKSDLSADFSDQTGNKESMTNWRAKILARRKASIKMNRIVVFTDFRECDGVPLCKRAGYGKRISPLQAFNRFLANV